MILALLLIASLADEVFKASGGENWPKVTAIQFTFNVSEGDKILLSRKHAWDVRGAKVAVTVEGKTSTVDLRAPQINEESKVAYGYWVNDSYWLLAPIKLRDPGVRVNPLSEDSFEVSFEAVGLTPKDRYIFYVDLATKLLRAWDYMPNPEKKLSGTWEGYREFGGLTLSTEHDFAGRRVWFSNVEVKTE